MWYNYKEKVTRKCVTPGIIFLNILYIVEYIVVFMSDRYMPHDLDFIYSETCLNWTSLGPTFVFRIDSCSDGYVRLIKTSSVRTLYKVRFTQDSSLQVYTGFFFTGLHRILLYRFTQDSCLQVYTGFLFTGLHRILLYRFTQDSCLQVYTGFLFTGLHRILVYSGYSLDRFTQDSCLFRA